MHGCVYKKAYLGSSLQTPVKQALISPAGKQVQPVTQVALVLDWLFKGAPLLPLLGTFADKAWYARSGARLLPTALQYAANRLW